MNTDHDLINKMRLTFILFLFYLFVSNNDPALDILYIILILKPETDFLFSGFNPNYHQVGTQRILM